VWCQTGFGAVPLNSRSNEGAALVTAANHLKTAASGRALGSECTDNHMAAPLNRAGDLADMGGTVTRQGEKMKDGAVVPNVVGRPLQFNQGDVRHLLGGALDRG